MRATRKKKKQRAKLKEANPVKKTVWPNGSSKNCGRKPPAGVGQIEKEKRSNYLQLSNGIVLDGKANHCFYGKEMKWLYDTNTFY